MRDGTKQQQPQQKLQKSSAKQQQLVNGHQQYAQTLSHLSTKHDTKSLRDSVAQSTSTATTASLRPLFSHNPQLNQALMQVARDHVGANGSCYNSQAAIGKQSEFYRFQLEPPAATSPLGALNKPLCRCRVMYLGSSVPHITKNGLHGIQEPLKHLYPEEQFCQSRLKQRNPLTDLQTIDISHLSSSLGIDSWLSVWSNGLLLENVDEFGREIKRFFSIDSLHYCAAVRFFDTSTLMSCNGGGNAAEVINETPSEQNDLSNSLVNDQNNNNTQAINKQQQDGDDEASAEPTNANPGEELARRQRARRSAIRFLPLDAPLFQCPGMLDPSHPPVFAAIMRRTTGIKVLECHAFICRRDAAANALVRCCTHAYADLLSARRLSLELNNPLVSNYCALPASRSTIGARHGVLTAAELNYKRGFTLNPRSKLRAAKRASNPLAYESQQSATTAAVTIHRQQQRAFLPDSIGNRSSTEEDNSLENSSEDNYAIISKHHHNQQQGRESHGSSKENSTIEQGKCKTPSGATLKQNPKGSSRSLFDDFQPRTSCELPACCELASSKDRRSARLSKTDEKLSHSLDLLELQDNTCCDASTAVDNGDLVHYSLINKNKRHSKSMQNLEGGGYEFTAPQANVSDSDRRKTRSRHRIQHQESRRRGQSSRHSSGNSREGSRKAQSCQNMIFMTEEQPRVDDSNATSLSSNNSQNIKKTYQVNSSANHGHYQLNEANDSITVERLQQPELPLERPYYSPKLSSRWKKSSVKSSKTTRSRRHEIPSQPLEGPPPPPPLSSLINVAQPHNPYYHPQSYPAGPAPMAYHLPPYAGYHPLAAPHYHHQAPVYAPPNIYDSVPMRPYPLVLASPHHQQQLHYANAAAAAGLYGSSNASMTLKPVSSHSSRKSKQLNNKTTSSSSLATKFRCLSPPVNFIFSHNKQHQRASSPAISGAGPVGGQTGIQDEPGTETHSPTMSSEQALEVVSAKPGFISHVSLPREKKMSWIKRLSLTMASPTSNNNNNVEHALNQEGAKVNVPQDASLSSDPSGAGASRERKKSSSLFSGSLTLGRKKQPQHAKLVTSQ